MELIRKITYNKIFDIITSYKVIFISYSLSLVLFISAKNSIKKYSFEDGKLVEYRASVNIDDKNDPIDLPLHNRKEVYAIINNKKITIKSEEDERPY